MAMVIKNNIAAQLVLGELNKNSDKLRKSLEKVSSGQKINSAKDDASNYVISEKMREQVRSLSQDNQNVQNGSSLFKIADGGINSIVEELRNLKELAVNAANDTNTDIDRQTIQKEFRQKYANINDIATTTNYNGKTLLDGTYTKPIKKIISNAELSNAIQGAGSALPPNYTSIFQNVSEPTGTPTTISGTNFTISSDGVYEIAAGFTGTINVNATNVKITQANPSNILNDVQIVGPIGGNANLWIENLNITQSANVSTISFFGNNNVLTVCGNNTFTETYYTGGGYSETYIDVGQGTNVQGHGNHSLTLSTGQNSSGNLISGGTGIGSSTTGFFYQADMGLVNLNLNFEGHHSILLGAGAGYGKIGNIAIENSTITSTYHSGALIPSNNVNNQSGDIKIISSTFKYTGTSTTFIGVIADIGAGHIGNIEIQNSDLAIGHIGSGIGTASSCGDIYISNSKITGRTAPIIGTGSSNSISRSTTGDITVVNGTSVIDLITNFQSTGAVIGSAEYGIVGDIYISQSSLDLVNSPNCWQDSNTQTYLGIGAGKIGTAGTTTLIDDDEWYKNLVSQNSTNTMIISGNALKIHHGTKANQATNFFINDMHTKSLGTEKLFSDNESLSDWERIVNEQDQERYDALSYDENLQSAWVETLKASQNKSLDDISVTTKQNANIAIRVLDGAIEYALNEATQIGAYLQRLEYTDANITTMGENTQAAESTIRDADMAKEMTDYTKNNVLLQASQSMLAQANQNSSAVLSLLQ